MPAVIQLPAGKAPTVRAAADVFLDSLGNPNTVRNYGSGVGKTADVRPDIGLARPSYGRARMLLDEHTALGGGPGTGWDLHEWRHSGLIADCWSTGGANAHLWPWLSQWAMSAMTAGSTCCGVPYSAGVDGPAPGKNRWLSAS